MTANELLEFRKRLHLSRREAAEKLGCSQKSISNWEKGINKIPDYIALAVSAVAMNLPKYGNNQ
jgi:transcriptional regulator with XRE-family HTH domain